MSTTTAPLNTEAAKPDADALAVKAPKKTKGENFLGWLVWSVDYVVVLATSVGLAYYLRDSSQPAWSGKTDKNGTKESWKDWTARQKDAVSKWGMLKGREGKDLLDNERIASILVDTTVTWPGGFVILPVTRMIEKNAPGIVEWYNRKFGTAEEVEAGKENMKDHKVASWGALLRGRLTSFAIVFTSFLSLEALQGITGKWMGSFVEGSSKAAVSFGNMFYKKDIHPDADNNKESSAGYRWKQVGDLFAFDSIATLASVSITLLIAKLRGKKAEPQTQQKPAEATKTAPAQQAPRDERDTASTPDEARKSYTEKETPKEKPTARNSDYREERQKEKAAAPNLSLANA